MSSDSAAVSVPVEASSDGPRKLQSNALGLLATASLTAAYMGPALSIYALLGPMTDFAGKGLGFVMLIAMVLTLMSAISFGMLAKEMPSAGGVYAWSRAALGESVGFWLGISTTIYYIISLIFPPIVFGQFFNELLKQLHCPVVNNGTWLIGALLMFLAAAAVVYRGITVSSHMAFTLLMVEIAVIAALAITLIASAIKHGTFTIAPITFEAVKGGWHGVFLALPMAFMCMVCDAATPASEETHNAKWTIPVAVILTCFIIGLWYIVGFSAFSLAATPEDMAIAADTNQSVVAPIAARMWGPMQILVSITAMTASLGAFIPCAIAASRVMFAMARESRLPRGLSKLHPRFLAPWNALHIVFIAVILGTIPPVFMFSSKDDIMSWWSFVLGWFIGIVYVAANLVNIVYYARFARERFNFILNGLLPAVALIVEIIIIWRSALYDPWHNGRMGRSALAAIALLSVSSGIYVLYIKSCKSGDVVQRGFAPVPVDAK